VPSYKVFHCPQCHQRWGRRPLTEHQLRILRWLREYEYLHRMAPRFSEIQAHFGFRSSATVHEHLTNLAEKGYIVRSAHNAERGISLVPPIP
jgi:SOS-response transcriptional repressor LexA